MNISKVTNSTLIEECDFMSIRTRHYLMLAGIDTVGDLLDKSKSELYAMRGLGRRSLSEIDEFINSLELNKEDNSKVSAIMTEVSVGDGVMYGIYVKSKSAYKLLFLEKDFGVANNITCGINEGTIKYIYDSK